MPAETRRSFIIKSLAAAAILGIRGIPGSSVLAESAPVAESLKSPTQLMESYMREIVDPPLLPPAETPFEPITPQPIGRKGSVYHAFPYQSESGRRLVVTLTAGEAGEPKLLTVRLIEDNVTGNVRSKFTEDSLNPAMSGFKTSPLLRDESWFLSDNEYIEGKPPTAEKTVITPDGYMESLSARLNRQGSYQIIYIAARAFPGSTQFEKRTVFAPTE